MENADLNPVRKLSKNAGNTSGSAIEFFKPRTGAASGPQKPGSQKESAGRPAAGHEIDAKLLRSFLSAAAESNFSAAAARLGCSATVISLRIDALEQRLGYRLFERNGRDVRLTTSGREFLDRARTLVELHDRLQQRARSLRASGIVRLGIAAGCMNPFLSRLLHCLSDSRPALEVDVVCAPGAQLHRKMRVRDLDLAVLASRKIWPSSTLLSRRRLHWVASPEFVLDDGAPLPVAWRPRGCCFRSSGLEALAGHGVSFREALCGSGDDAILGVVGAGAAVTIMAEGTVPAGLRTLASPALLPPLDTVVLQLLERPGPHSGAVQRVKRVLARVYRGA